MTSKAFGLAQLGNAYSDGALSNRNKIINGGMVIDQRNAGAAVTVNSNAASFFSVDRFSGLGNGSAGVFTLQQDSSAPAGFVKSLKAVVTTIDSSISSENYRVQYKIEGNDVADLGFGLATAKTITLSFWVRSSETGTFGASVKNSAQNRSYPFTYSVSSADTWEYKTITIAGDTTGTWLTDTGVGLWITWSLGGDTNNAAGAWIGANSIGATGQINLMATLNATWYITGVQLEVGDTATPFEHRSYGQELALCERYYTTLTTATLRNAVANYYVTSDVSHTTTMRAPPTVTYSFSTAGSAVADNDSASTSSRVKTIRFQCRFTTVTTTGLANFSNITADAEL